MIVITHYYPQVQKGYGQVQQTKSGLYCSFIVRNKLNKKFISNTGLLATITPYTPKIYLAKDPSYNSKKLQILQCYITL